jgi:hypothetical protein
MAGKGQPGTTSKFRGLQISDAPSPPAIGRRPYVPPEPDFPGLADAVWANYQANTPVAQQQAKWTYKWIFPIAPDDVEDVRMELLKAKNWLEYTHKVKINGLEKKDVVVLHQDDIADSEVRKRVPAGMCALRFAAHPPMNKGVRAAQSKVSQDGIAGRGRARNAEVTAHRSRS